MRIQLKTIQVRVEVAIQGHPVADVVLAVVLDLKDHQSKASRGVFEVVLDPANHPSTVLGASLWAIEVVLDLVSPPAAVIEATEVVLRYLVNIPPAYRLAVSLIIACALLLVLVAVTTAIEVTEISIFL